MSAGTPKESVKHPLFARLYMRMSRKRHETEDEHRTKMLAGLAGQVIEVGAGNGLNFSLYPEAVERVLAVEPEPRLRAAALEEAEDAPVEIEVVDGVAAALPADDGSQDAVVASLVLCSVRDQAEALAEMKRVLKPGGELRFYEHVQSDTQPLRSVLTFADKTFWPKLAGGCHATRHTDEAIERAGFEIESVRRFKFSPGFPVPKTPHILGRARSA